MNDYTYIDPDYTYSDPQTGILRNIEKTLNAVIFFLSLKVLNVPGVLRN
jgi:hypothetical protein